MALKRGEDAGEDERERAGKRRVRFSKSGESKEEEERG